jgi:hypothetical protein
VVGHEGYFQRLKLRGINSKKGYVRGVQKDVGLNVNCHLINHEVSPWEMLAGQISGVQPPLRIKVAGLAHPLCSHLSAVKRRNDYILYNHHIQGCIQKFPDWLPGARTTNGTALCHYVQLYHYFVNQSSEFCCHNPLKGTAKCTSHYQISLQTFGYTLVFIFSGLGSNSRGLELFIIALSLYTNRLWLMLLKYEHLHKSLLPI